MIQKYISKVAYLLIATFLLNQTNAVGQVSMSNPQATSYKIEANAPIASYKIDTMPASSGILKQPESYKMAPASSAYGDQGGKSFLGNLTGGFITALDRANSIKTVKIENSTNYELAIVKADTALFEETVLSTAGPNEPVIIPANTKEFYLEKDIRDTNKSDVHEYIAFFIIDGEPIEVCRFLYGIACNKEIMHMEIPKNYNNPNKKEASFYIERFDKLPPEGGCGLLKENKSPDSMFPRLRHTELFTKWGAYHRNFSNITFETATGGMIEIEVMGIYLMADDHWVGIYFRNIKNKKPTVKDAEKISNK